MSKRIVGALVIAAVTVFGAYFALTSPERTEAEKIVLRMHQFLPLQSGVPKNILQVWADKVEAESNGRIEVQHFPSMQLGGKPPELVDQVIDGVVDIIWTLPGYTPGRFSRAEVFELPFTMTNAEATSSALWELAQRHMINADFKDLKVLALWVHGPGIIHSKDPIVLPRDLDGVKMRAPTRVVTKMLDTLGATSIGMPVPGVPAALSKGVIDGTAIPWEVAMGLKVPELVHNHTQFGDASLYTATFLFAMNKNTYNSLPDDLKAVIDANSDAEFSAFAGRVHQSLDEKPRQAARKLGNNIITLTPDQVEVWRAASKNTATAWAEEMDAKGINGTMLLREATELIEKYSR